MYRRVKTAIAIAAVIVATAFPAQSHAGNAWDGPGPQTADAERPAPSIAKPSTPLPSAPRWGAIALRLDLSEQLFGGSLTGVEVSYRFPVPVGIDVALGRNDMGYGHTGLAADAMARLYLFNDSSGGVSLAGGASLRDANEFGTVGFVTGELAVEYRPRGGFNILVGAGMATALNDSGQAQ